MIKLTKEEIAELREKEKLSGMLRQCPTITNGQLTKLLDAAEENIRLREALECLYAGNAWSAFSAATNDVWTVSSNGMKLKTVEESLAIASAALAGEKK